jgi:iron complex transport system ATP-binding protein
MNDSVVQVERVTFFRKDRAILSDVDWTIEKAQHWALPGERVAVLGANGSGKTTLLKLICGYEWPTFGTVRVLGERFGACDIRTLRKLIGWVSPAMCHQLPGHDSAVQVIASGLEASIGLYRTFSDDELETARKLLTHLGADNIADQRYNTLSQGEQQKVLIARALVSDPKLLILDEPCVGLDPAARERFLQDLDGFAALDDAPTMILVTHHIEEIRPWIGQVLMLKDGQVLAQGRPEDVICATTMNALFNCQCRVGKGESGYWLRMETTE